MDIYTKIKNKNKLTRHQKEDRASSVKVTNVIRYYDDNNLGLPDTWYKTKLQHKIYKTFDKIWNEETEFNMNTAVQEFRYILPTLEKYLKLIKTDTGDGSGYGEDNDYGNLCYISDRWNCEFRLAWLINLVQRGYFYEFIEDKTGGDWKKENS